MTTNENKMYKCGICGKTYDTIVDRSKCEANCVAKQKEDAAKAAELKKKSEQEARTKELEDAIIATNEQIDKTIDLLEKYLNDYDTFSTELDCPWIDAINMFDEDEDGLDLLNCFFCN